MNKRTLEYLAFSELDKIAFLYPPTDSSINFRPYYSTMGNNLIEAKDNIILPVYPSSVSNTFIIPTREIVSASFGPSHTLGVDSNHNLYGWGEHKDNFIPKGFYHEKLNVNKYSIILEEPVLNIDCNHLMNMAIGISGTIYWWNRNNPMKSIYNFKNQLVDAKLIGENIVAHLTDCGLYLINTKTSDVRHLFEDLKVLDFMTYNGLENIVFVTIDGKLYIDGKLKELDKRVKTLTAGTTRNNEICVILTDNTKVLIQLNRKFVIKNGIIV